MAGIDSDENKIRWFLIGCYVVESVMLLPDEVNLKLTHLAEQYAGEVTWREVVEDDVGISSDFVFDTHTAMSKYLSNREALVFIMRAIGCPSPEARINDVLGL